MNLNRAVQCLRNARRRRDRQNETAIEASVRRSNRNESSKRIIALEILLFQNMIVENSMKFVSFVEPYFGIENETKAELTQNVAILEKLVQCHLL